MNELKPSPCTLIIFGATGDLTKRKLLPALYRLSVLKLLPDPFNIVGLSSRALSNTAFREHVSSALKEFYPFKPLGQDSVKKFVERIYFISSAFDNLEGYLRLSERLSEIEQKEGVIPGKIFYLATPPSFFITITEMLSRAGLPTQKLNEPYAPRVIIEKPFGRDLSSAKELNNLVLKYFKEEQIYRIDHYLGKETVQNILFFRFTNGIYEPIWDRRYIDHVQITVVETIGVENRGKYFEESGILRDMVQNHILQLLALFAMEPPNSLGAEVIRGKKIELLNSLRAITSEEIGSNTVRGQYGSGQLKGEKIPAYREERNVSPASLTETFVALKIFIDNWRWAGVPFYIRSGKRLKKHLTEIVIHFKSVPHCLFTRNMKGCPENNMLVLKIQPDEGITFGFNVKKPGSTNRLERVTMDFSYRQSFKTELPRAYERLILDCMLGDSTLFPHSRGIEASWAFTTGILEGWGQLPPPRFPNYLPHSWGPGAADELLAREGRFWRNP